MSQLFGIIPAAGHSRRMGTNKLLLPWNNSTILETVLRAWHESSVDRVVIVLRKGDVAGQTLVSQFDVDLVLPEHDPADMKRSVQHALMHIQSTYRPQHDDAWLLAPADLPTLRTETIDHLVTAYRADPGRILVPFEGEKRGHPVVFPMEKSDEVFRLKVNEGVNALLDTKEFQRIAVHNVIFDDIDTPNDYRRVSDLEKDA